MKKTIDFTLLTNWLYSTEIFARPSRQLPGRWRLFECYSEPGEQLINLKEEDLKQAGFYWEIDFDQYGQLTQQKNLPVKFVTDASVCSWQITRNFLKLFIKGTTEKMEVFQFAVSRGELKLLQKNSDGKIIFFGFFRKAEESNK